MRALKIFTVVAAVAVASPILAADTYTIDVAHSEIGFAVKHMVISTVTGKFTDLEGTIIYDAENPTNSSVAVTIKASSIDTNNDTRDKHLRSEDFFAVDTYPDITFKSTRITSSDSGLVAHGPLTMHGVTKEIALPFSITGVIKDPWGNTRLGVDIEPIELDRTAFGISWSKTLDGGGLVVSNTVTVKLGIEAVKQKEE